MIAGTAIVESVFSWPGIGNYAVNAIFARNLPVINAYVLIMATIFVICNLLADIINVVLNPQMLKESGSGKSTLARLIMGIEKPTYGEIFYKNKSITNMSRVKRS